MKLIKILNEIEYDYRMQHTSPDKDSGAPLYDLTKNEIYPDDVYSNKAIQYYGTRFADNETFSIIKRCKDNPDAIVTIYRAMPDLQAESNAKIKDINTLIQYVESFGIVPMSNKKIKTYAADNFFSNIRDKFGYGEGMISDKDKYLDYLYSERKKIKDSQIKKSEINPGDWVSITKEYAKRHKESNGNPDWTIVSKKVKASNIYTDGNSWDEWGYHL